MKGRRELPTMKEVRYSFPYRKLLFEYPSIDRARIYGFSDRRIKKRGVAVNQERF